jgi:hypothetical protein
MRLKLHSDEVIAFCAAAMWFQQRCHPAPVLHEKLIISVSNDFQLKQLLKVMVNKPKTFTIKFSNPELIAFNLIFNYWNPEDPFQAAIKAKFHQQFDIACLSI